MALASASLCINEMAAYYSINICCTFLLYVDSTGAITNVEQLRYRIPKRRFPDNADILCTLKSAPHVLSHFRFQHVKSHQDDEVDFAELPFPAQLNVLCDCMATEQMQRQLTDANECSSNIVLTPRDLPIEVCYGQQIISSHYISRLREAISADLQRIYLQATQVSLA